MEVLKQALLMLRDMAYICIMSRLLAQINIAHLKAPIDHPSIADFSDNLDKINSIAESSDGFVWRLKDEDNNATSFNPYNNELIIVNISVWQNLETLKNYVYHTDHIAFFKRSSGCFIPMKQGHMALWHIEEGAYPDAEEGKKRLDHLNEHGASAFAFDYRSIEQFS